MLFSYVILCDFFPLHNVGIAETRFNLNISLPEIILIIWTATYLLEEMRQVIILTTKILIKILNRHFTISLYSSTQTRIECTRQNLKVSLVIF